LSDVSNGGIPLVKVHFSISISGDRSININVDLRAARERENARSMRERKSPPASSRRNRAAIGQGVDLMERGDP